MQHERFHKLERQVRFLSLYAVLTTGTFGALAVSAFTSLGKDVIRTRGIIIEDANGRERILIGAPIPYAKNRVRTDLARVEKEWAGRYPKPADYMKYYQNYRHSMIGMLVLNDQGFDRLAVGDSIPDPNVGRRIGPGTGIEINDARGNERSGYGMLTVQGTDRVVLGLDHKKSGTEGLYLMLDDNGGVQLGMQSNGKSATFGTIVEPGDTGSAASFGLVVRDGKSIKHQFTVPQ